ncbi:MAG: leucine-rich repeat protein [Alistipes sp.]|nr:leucine-rich repeat protein [Alistipes sp.]
MKKMFFVVALFCATLFSSCGDDYDDSALWNGLNSLEARVAKLEELCKQMNTNISSLQTLVAALQSNDYVTGITPVTKSGETIGYTITFSKSNPITIYHGEDGKDGTNGTNGKDGHTPVVGVKKHTDGVYYWTLDGNWLLDAAGNKIKASGTDGATGTNGKDGITPQLKIENEYWYVSYDNGKTWEEVGKATGEDGENGASGDSMFASIDNTTSAEYVIFTLSDGTQIKLPTWSAFEALRTQCNQMNTNIESLRALINVLESHDYIQSVTPLMEDGTQVGYTINFAYSNPVTIYSNASSSSAPIIGVKKDADNVYYWTLDGEWLLDDDGNKIKAEAKDGDDGNEGITPKLKIEDGYWYVSYDNGTSWTKLGKATGADGLNGSDGEDGDNIFTSVTQDEGYVYFNLADGTIITLAKQDKENIQFEDLQVKAICCKYWDANGDGELSYTEAAKVTSIGQIFRENSKIIAFNELKYFTKINKIEAYAFYKCTSLWKITMPANVTEIDLYAFNLCSSLCYLELSNNIKTIRECAFGGCSSIINLRIPDSVETIEKSAFGGLDGLKTTYIGRGVISWGAGAFSKCTGSLFCYSNIRDATTTTRTFADSDFSKATIGGEQIGTYAFSENGTYGEKAPLETLIIENTVKVIGSYAANTDTLRYVYCKSTNPPQGADKMFYSGLIYIYVPKGSGEVYKNAAYWQDYASKIVEYDFE